MPPERWRRLKALRPAIPLLLPLAVLLGVYVLQAIRDQRQLEQALAEADRLDPGWRWEELEARRPPIADADNGRFPIEAAFQLIPKVRNSDHWFLKEVDEAFQDDLAPEIQLTEVQRRALREELTAADAVLREARRLADFPQGRFPVAWKPDVLSTVLEYVEAVRTIANVLHYDVIWRADQQDPDGAILSCRAILNTGRAIGDEPTLISQLVRHAVHSFTVRGIERALAQGEPSDAALLSLQQLLEQEVNGPPLVLIALRGERASLDRMMRNLENGKVPIHKWLGYFGSGGSRGNPLFRNLEMFLSGCLKRQRASLVHLLTDIVEAAKLPPEQRAAWFKAQGPTLASQPWAVQMFLPGVFRLEPSFRRGEAELRCALVMVAVERFRRRHGRWPESLNELVPEFLVQLPTDPCNGLPLCYRHLKDGVVIYSVAEDGVDNGGTILRRGAMKAGVDWGVRLWDVPRRRRPAPAPAPTGLPELPANPGK